jgi:Zn-dependent protease
VFLPGGNAAHPVLVIGEDSQAISQAAQAPLDAAIAPADEAVLCELRQLDKRPSWVGAILLLVFSLLLFVGAAGQADAWRGILILVVVILFHEGGHYAAMRYFGYRNLRMFFIPFFGAAVSGRHYNVAGWQKSLVALAGPVPGILLGAPLGVLGLMLAEPNLIQASLVLLWLNGFNLLPFLPLDGGWVVHSVLFVRHPVLDVAFRVVASLGLLGIALLMGAWVLVGLAVVMLIATPTAWRLANIAHRLRKEGVSTVSTDNETIPVPTALAILAAIRPVLPPQAAPKLLAPHVANVFGALNATPPGSLGTLAVLALHGGSFMIALVMSIAIMVLREQLKL